MDGKNQRIDGWMDGWVEDFMDGRMNEWKIAWMDI